MEKPSVIDDIIPILKREEEFKLFKTPWSVNLGAIRTKDNKSNKFNDWIYAFCHSDSGDVIYRIVEGTTDAGLYYRKNNMNPEGTAIIQHGVHHRGVYQLQDPSKNHSQRGHKGRKAFRQIKPMTYWRDSNRDEYLDFTGEITKEIAYTNGHYMGNVGNDVNKWSAGCWGAKEENQDEIYYIGDLQIKHGLGDKFSFALLYEEMF